MRENGQRFHESSVDVFNNIGKSIQEEEARNDEVNQLVFDLKYSYVADSTAYPEAFTNLGLGMRRR